MHESAWALAVCGCRCLYSLNFLLVDHLYYLLAGTSVRCSSTRHLNCVVDAHWITTRALEKKSFSTYEALGER
jgi:hypothetical protein